MEKINSSIGKYECKYICGFKIVPYSVNHASLIGFQAILITTYKEANQLQHSCISLPIVIVPVITSHM